MNVQIRETVAAPPSVYFSDAYGLALAQAPEQRWVTLATDDETWLMPLVLNQVGDGRWEASSPYGYSGVYVAPSMSSADAVRAWQAAIEILQGLGVVSLFLRFAPYELSSVEASRVFPGLELLHVSDTIAVDTTGLDSMWSSLQGRARTAVRKAQKLGMVSKIETVLRDQVMDGGSFRVLYEQTMQRVAASNVHFYADSYYERLLDGLGDRLRTATVMSATGEVAAAALMFVDDSIVHYHLSGSAPEHARNGANNLLVWTLLEWSQAHGRRLAHLGGGTSAADSLFRFKASFGGKTLPYHVGRCVVDAPVYEQLVLDQAERLGVDPSALSRGSFFPAYRAGLVS